MSPGLCGVFPHCNVSATEAWVCLGGAEGTESGEKKISVYARHGFRRVYTLIFSGAQN
jgi:hypothetical protein